MNRHKDSKQKIAVVEMFKAVCACNYYQNKWIPDFLWFHIIMQEFNLMEDEATHIGLFLDIYPVNSNISFHIYWYTSRMCSMCIQTF